MAWMFGPICAPFIHDTQQFFRLVRLQESPRAQKVSLWCVTGGDGLLRILIADDHEVARRGIRALLEAHPGWEVCGEAKDGRETVELANTLKPDLILLDIGMPNLNGLEAARQILAASPEAAILILTMHDSDHVVREVLRAGARGFLLKSDAGRDLVAAVEALQRQRTFFTTRVSQMLLDGYLDRENQDERASEDFDDVLTTREREVIQLLAEGKTSKEVAITLNLSVKTAETHRTNLMRKLGLHSVADLTRYAVRNGIVQVF
jgi:DNA-binding NarL/FixJ family response regulator